MEEMLNTHGAMEIFNAQVNIAFWDKLEGEYNHYNVPNKYQVCILFQLMVNGQIGVDGRLVVQHVLPTP